MVTGSHEEDHHLAANLTGPTSSLGEKVVTILQHLRKQALEGIEISVPHCQRYLVIVVDLEGEAPHLVNVLGDASGHTAQETFCVCNQPQILFMLCDEGVNDSFLLLQTKVEDPTGWNLAFSKTNISGMACPISMESLCNSGGDKEHPVQIITALAQSLSGDKALGNRIPILIPFQVHIQINTLTRTIIGGAEDICALGNLPSVLPPLIQQEIFVR